MRWLDKTAGTGVFEHFDGTSWRAWMLWLKDRPLYVKCKGGLFTPAIWRLFEMGKRKPWAEARKQIWADNNLAEREARDRYDAWKSSNNV